MPTDARGVRSPRSGVTGAYESPSVDAGNQTGLLQGQDVFLTTESSKINVIFNFCEFCLHVHARVTECT